MDVEKLFHMAGGNGEHSYAQNSFLQKKASDRVKYITVEALQEVYVGLRPNSFGIADLGCSSGPNTLSFIKETVEAIDEAVSSFRPKAPEFIRVYLNDLPTNDFNSIFKSLPDLYRELRSSSSLLVAACPGSFYGRLFPDDFLHFVYSSYSLHWLSKVPPRVYDEQGRSINKGKIYISETSPPSVAQAYESQFQQDFSLFLLLRSQELVSGGRMVLISLGRIGHDHVDRGNYIFWEILSRSLAILASQGMIDREKLDSYDVHFYAASKDEMEAGIVRNGDFLIERLEMCESGKDDDYGGRRSSGADLAMTVRAIQGPMLGHHFGEEILDPLFDLFGRLVDEEMAQQEIKPIAFVVVLKKL